MTVLFGCVSKYTSPSGCVSETIVADGTIPSALAKQASAYYLDNNGCVLLLSDHHHEIFLPDMCSFDVFASRDGKRNMPPRC